MLEMCLWFLVNHSETGLHKDHKSGLDRFCIYVQDSGNPHQSLLCTLPKASNSFLINLIISNSFLINSYYSILNPRVFIDLPFYLLLVKV